MKEARSPCLTCEHRDEDKNCERCANCRLRIEYARREYLIPEEERRMEKNDGRKNKLIDLNDHLFEEMERLSKQSLKGDELREEINRAKSVANIAAQIINNANLVLKVQKAITDGLIEGAPKMLGTEPITEEDDE